MTETTEPTAGDSGMWNRLLKALAEIVAAIDDNLAAGRELPALLLLYAGIDLLAWLEAPGDQTELRGSDFKSWCLRYLLPESGLECNANELWAARCALLHNAAAEARELRKAGTRTIVYTSAANRPETAAVAASDAKAECRTVAVAALRDAFQQAVTRHCEEFDRPDMPTAREAALLRRAARVLDGWSRA
ncbi:MAG: hypothetical protein AB1601_02390 [Planctomycetota bacterium]